MVKVTVDITGFYFSTEFDDDTSPNPSVREVTEAVIGQQGTNGRGTLRTAEFSPRGFLNKLEVLFTQDNPPLSRQLKSDSDTRSPINLPPGLYRYRDEPGRNANSCDSLSNSLTLAWQYYVFRIAQLADGTTGRVLANGSEGTERRIVPAAEFPLEEGDILKWRLVAIGGIIEATPESAIMNNMEAIMDGGMGALSVAAMVQSEEE